MCRRLLDRSKSCCLKTKPTIPVCSVISRQETGCIKAEPRQHATNFHRWHLQPFRCNESQLRRHRGELDRLSFVVHSLAATTLGHPSRKHQDWFDENDQDIKSLLEAKHRLHKARQDDTSSVSKDAAYSNIYKTVQDRIRDMQDSWLSKKKSSILQTEFEKGHEEVPSCTENSLWPKRSGASPPLNTDGSSLSLIKIISWKGGQSTSIACSIAHQL